MKSYRELIEQTFEFPQREFKVRDHELLFNDVPIMEVIKQYGTPLRVTYLPKISENIRFAQSAFNGAMERFKYQGSYTYCYCTKSSHYDFVLEEALKNDIHIETSSAFDIPIVRTLYERGKISKDTFVLCNGFKMPQYKEYITGLLNESFNCIPILDKLCLTMKLAVSVCIKFSNRLCTLNVVWVVFFLIQLVSFSAAYSAGVS